MPGFLVHICPTRTRSTPWAFYCRFWERTKWHLPLDWNLRACWVLQLLMPCCYHEKPQIGVKHSKNESQDMKRCQKLRVLSISKFSCQKWDLFSNKQTILWLTKKKKKIQKQRFISDQKCKKALYRNILY